MRTENTVKCILMDSNFSFWTGVEISKQIKPPRTELFPYQKEGNTFPDSFQTSECMKQYIQNV